MSGRIEPGIFSEVSAPFWEATKEHKFVLQWCRSCGKVVHYPRELCPFCLSEDLEFRPASGRGEVYAFTVHHRASFGGMEDRVPYVVALVDLDEGARMMTNIVGFEPSEVAVGMKVRVTWEDLSEGKALPVFEAAGSERVSRNIKEDQCL
jgi:hypothetical protein